jgi:hypothetical protein
MKRNDMWLFVGLLVVVSLACSGFGASRRGRGTEATAVVETEVTVTVREEEGGETMREADEEGEEAAPTATAEPSPTPMATDTPGATATSAPVKAEAGDGVFPEVDRRSMEALRSYRSDMLLQVTAEDDTGGRFAVEHAVNRDGPAQRLLMQVEGMEDFGVEIGDLGGSFEIEVIQIEGQLWMRMGEQWMQTPAQDADPAGELTNMFDVAELLDDIEDMDYEYLGREVVNGVDTRHFQFEAESLSRLFDLGETEMAQEGTVDIWVADEADLPAFAARMMMTSEGEVEGKQTQTTFELNVYDVNDPSINIQPPKEAASATWPGDIPEYDGAQDVSLMEGLVVFFTEDDVETVAEFYREELELAGWEQQETFAADAVVETWTKEGQTLNVMINVDEERGATQVAITVEDAE